MPVPSDWSQQELIGKLTSKRYTGDEDPLQSCVQTEQVSSWEEILGWFKEFPGSWCFRGQRESGWSLLTSLDRAVRRDFSSEDADGFTVSGHYNLPRKKEGRRLLLEFSGQANPAPSGDGDLGSCFATMQHYGRPTSFLDWTESPHVAAYFAFEKAADQGQKRSAIWAIDLNLVEKRGRELLSAGAFASAANADRESLARWENHLIADCQEPVIIRVNPLEINERMAAQKGVLLCNLFDEAQFSLILTTMMIHPEILDQPMVRKLEVDTTHRTEFLAILRAMNIHKGSLFPDLHLQYSTDHRTSPTAFQVLHSG
jgi:hypothetical protein